MVSNSRSPRPLELEHGERGHPARLARIDLSKFAITLPPSLPDSR